MAVEVATGYVSIVPSMRGFGTALTAQVARDAASAGAVASKSLTSAMNPAKVETAGKNLSAKVTAPIVALGGASVMLAAKFESSMSQVAQALGKPGQPIDDLTALAKKMGAETQYSANEAAQAMVALAKGGMSDAQIKAGALQSAMALAAAGQLDLANAADLTVQAMGAFDLSAQDATMIADSLSGAANASASNVSDLAQALTQVGAQAYQTGMELPEVTAALAAMSNAGINGSDAGTSLKTMLARLVPQTKKARDAMAEYGLSFTNADGSIKSMQEVAGILQRKLGGLSQEQRQTALSTIFGSDAYRAAAILMEEGADGIAAYEEATRKSGTAQEAAAANLGPTARAMEELGGAAETAGIAFGEALAPLVRVGAGALQKVVNAFSALPGPVQTTVAGFLALVAATGPIMYIGAKLVQSFAVVKGALMGERAALIANRAAWLARQTAAVANFLIQGVVVVAQATAAWIANTASVVANRVATVASRVAMLAVRAAIIAWTAAQWALNVALNANPISLIIIAIVGLIALIVVLWKKNEGFRNVVLAVWEAIKTAAVTIWNTIVGALTAAWNTIVSVARTVWGGFRAFFGALWQGIVGYVKFYIGLVKTVLSAAWTAIKTTTAVAWTAIKTVIVNPMKVLWARLESVVKTVRDNLAVAWTAIKNATSEAWEKVKNAIVTPVANLWDSIREFITGDTGLKGRLADTWTVIKTTASDTWTAIMDAIKKPIRDAVAWIENKFQWLIDLKDKFLGGGGGWGDGWRNDWLSIGTPGTGGGQYNGNAAGSTRWTGGVGQPGAQFMQAGNWTWNGGHHNGTDVGAAEGTPVFTTRLGVVTFAGDTGDWAGKNVQVRLANGVTLQFAHLSSIAAQVGQVVRPGAMLGRVGNTGRSFGPHLHVSAIPPGGGTYIDPIPFLADGGIVKASKGGTLAVLGEAGRNEMVLPLPPGLSRMSTPRLAENLLGGGGGTTHNWTVYTRDEPFEQRVITEWRRMEALAGL